MPEVLGAEFRFINTPNLLTLSRVAMVPLVIGLLYLKTPLFDVAAGILFAVAAITDYFDGYLARKQKLVSVFGKLMDPLADKFLVVSSLIMLQYLDRVHPVVVMVLICRELAVTSLRALASAEGIIIAASKSAKWKTVTQMVAIPFLMGRELFGIPLVEAGNVLLYFSVAISLWSARDYVVGFFKAVQDGARQKAAARKLQRQARHAARRARIAARARATENR